MLNCDGLNTTTKGTHSLGECVRRVFQVLSDAQAEAFERIALDAGLLGVCSCGELVGYGDSCVSADHR